jgi:hypothetical protein
MFILFYIHAASQAFIQSQAHFQWTHKKYSLLYVACYHFGLYSKIHPFQSKGEAIRNILFKDNKHF